MRKEFKGDCIGIRLSNRSGHGDKHICFTLLTEDDEDWIETNFNVSSAWLDETIQMLEAAKAYMKSSANPDIFEGIQYGWKFK